MSDGNDSFLVKQQKYRATRIDPNYPSKPNALRRLMWLLSRLLPLVGIIVLLALTFNPFSSGGRTVYEPGPVSAQHSFFNQRCEDCHESQFGKFGLVSNSKCTKCHDGPLHNVNQICPGGEKRLLAGVLDSKGQGIEVQEPRCATCHTEHQNHLKLVQMNDNHCTQCHGDLKLKGDAKLAVAKSITSFAPNGGHEEWRILRPEATKAMGNDPTPLRFNHKLHMPMNFEQASKFGARKMECADCHSSTDTNLEPLVEATTRLKDFEKDILGGDRDAFYDGVLAAASASGVTYTNLTRNDIRKLTGEALGLPPLSDREFATSDKKELKDDCADAIVRLVHQRLVNTPASGQTRYMRPINYERNCATECHWHKLPAVKLSDNTEVIPPHGKASEARKVLRAAIFADAVKQALNASASPEEKVVRGLVKRLRDALVKKAGENALAGKDKAAVNALLIKAMYDASPEPYLFVTGMFSADESLKLLPGILDQETITHYATMKEKKKTPLNEGIGNKLEELINAYAEERPLSMVSINALADERLADATKTLFGSKDSSIEKKEKGACLFCHEPTVKPASKPEKNELVADLFIPERWLNHAVFNHETHRVIDCESCHAQARTSDRTSDVLLPGIQSCQQCHNKQGARMECIECHLYHDKSHQTRDRFVSIDDLMKTGASKVKTRESTPTAEAPK